MSTDPDVQTAAATQLDEDGASSAVSPTLGAAVVLAKYPTLLLVVLAVGVLSRDIEPPLDYAIPDSSPAANSSAGMLVPDVTLAITGRPRPQSEMIGDRIVSGQNRY